VKQLVIQMCYPGQEWLDFRTLSWLEPDNLTEARIWLRDDRLRGSQQAEYRLVLRTTTDEALAETEE
jgi:hypothetical protein